MRKGMKMKEVEQMISMGEEKGFMTFDEVSEIPPNDIVSSDQIDDVLMMFDEMDIDVVDDLQGLKVEEEKAVEKGEEEGDELEMETFGRATDPVRMYPRGVTNEIDEEETSFEEEQVQKKKILELIDRMKRRDEEVRRLLKKRLVPRSKSQKQVKKKQEEILECFNQMNLRDIQINKIVQKMKQMLNRVEKGENEIKKIEERWGVSAQEARTYLKKLKARSVSEKKLLRTRKLSKADLQEMDRLV